MKKKMSALKMSDIKLLMKQKKKLILVVLLLVTLAVIGGSVWAVYSSYDTKYGDMPAFMVDSMMDANFEYLPNDEAQLQAVANIATSVMDELVGTATSKEEMVTAVKESIVSLGLGITDEEAQKLAEWLVDLYLQNYEDVYSDTDQINNNVSALGDTIINKMTQDLTSISDYLSQLDKSISQNKDSLQNITNTQTTNYAELQNYLNSLNTVVGDLKNQFAKYESSYSNNQNSAMAEFGDLKSKLDNLQGNIKDTETKLADRVKEASQSSNVQHTAITEKVQDEGSEIKKSIENLKENTKELLNEIKKTGNEQNGDMILNLESTQKALELMLTAMEEKNVDRHTQSEEDLQKTSESLHTNMNELDQNLTDVLADLKLTGTTQYDATINNIEVAKKDITQLLAEMKENDGNQQTEADESLKDTETNINNRIDILQMNIESILKDLQSFEETHNTIMVENIEASQAALTAILTDMERNNTDRHKTLSASMSNGVDQLMEQLINVHTDVITTQGTIQNYLKNMNDVTTEKMDTINKALEAIDTNMAAAHTELNTLIKALQVSEAENQKELLDTLTDIDTTFTAQSTQNFNALRTSLETTTNNMKTRFDDLNTSVNQNFALQTQNLQTQSDNIRLKVDQGLQTQTDTIKQKIDQDLQSQTTSLQQKMNQDLQTQTDHVKNQFDTLKGSLAQNFTNVFSGMTTNQTAVISRIEEVENNTNSRFNSLDGSLKSVFQSVSSGKQTLAAALLTKNVTVAANATFDEIKKAILAVPQKLVIGVEQIPGDVTYEYHYHTGSASSGGGCYTVEDIHRHNGDCYETCNYSDSGCIGGGSSSADGIDTCPFITNHSYCTGGKNETKYRTHGSGSHPQQTVSGSHLILVCGRTEGVRYGWKVGCGLSDGQIIAAKITYNTGANKVRTANLDQSIGKPIPDLPIWKLESPEETESGSKPTAPAETESVSKPTEPAETESGSKPTAPAETESGSKPAAPVETESRSEQAEPVETESRLETAVQVETERRSELAAA